MESIPGRTNGFVLASPAVELFAGQDLYLPFLDDQHAEPGGWAVGEVSLVLPLRGGVVGWGLARFLLASRARLFGEH